MNNIISIQNIITKFKGVREINNTELNSYVKYRNLTKIEILPLIFGLNFGGIGIPLIIGLIFNSYKKNIEEIIIILVISVLFIYLGILLILISLKNKKLFKKIMGGKMYIAEAYSFDKQILTEKEPNTGYYIMVWDDYHQIDKWFEISKDAYENSKIISGNLYVQDYNGEVILDFVSNYDLKNN